MNSTTTTPEAAVKNISQTAVFYILQAANRAEDDGSTDQARELRELGLALHTALKG